ncbi:MAG: acetolactate decarboxylase [Methanolobus sp.]
MRKKYTGIILILVFTVLAGGCINQTPDENGQIDDMSSTPDINDNTKTDTIYQFSTINALLEGIYDGEVSFGELKENGDFGLGTFNNLDGEMIQLEGIFYQVRADGKVYEVDDSQTSPFVAITFFETDIQDTVTTQMDSEQVEDSITQILPSRNLMYAVKITGNFSYMKTRSVAAQEKPYPRLVNVTKDQSVFEFNNTRGTIIGYWMPEYAEGINVPGFHLHFITEDKNAGGHILEYTIDSGTIELDSTDELYLDLPSNENYLGMGSSSVTDGELEEVEN